MHRLPTARVGLVALAATAAVVGLAACSDDPEAGRETTTTTELEPTTTTRAQEPADGTAEVLDAYRDSWRHYDDFVNRETAGDPADWFDGAQLERVTAKMAEYAEHGLELRGEAQLAPSDVVVDGSVARLTDCQIDGTYAVVTETEEVVVPAGTRPQRVDVRLVHDAGRWKVSSARYGPVGSCVP